MIELVYYHKIRELTFGLFSFHASKKEERRFTGLNVGRCGPNTIIIE